MRWHPFAVSLYCFGLSWVVVVLWWVVLFYPVMDCCGLLYCLVLSWLGLYWFVLLNNINAQNKSYLGTEELAHLEMICAMVHQLTRNLSEKEIVDSGFDKYFVDHTNAVFPIAASSLPWRAEYIQAKGDVLADLHEDLAAEQKARVTYDNLLRLIDDPDVLDPLRFLREREVVHYQRFGEAQPTKWNGKGGAADKTA